MKLICENPIGAFGSNGTDKPLQATRERSEIIDLLSQIVSFAAVDPSYDPYQAAGNRFAPLEQYFSELEPFAAESDQTLIREILLDREIVSMLPRAYAVRALYEHELEWRCANETITSSNAPQLIAKQVDGKHEALPSAFYDVLAGCKRILFAGSGPLPTTAMALCREFGRPIVCIDRDPRANELARAYVAGSECRFQIRFVDSDLADLSEFDEFDCIVCAFLIGVGTSTQPLETKSKFIRGVVKGLPPSFPLVLRSPQGLGRLIYPSLDSSYFEGFDFTEYPGSSLHCVPYDKPFTTIKKSR